jgi:YD repeat-containing protein
VAGYQKDVIIERGLSGTPPPIPQETWTYFTQTVGGRTVHPVATDRVYRSTGGNEAETTTYTYSWFSGTVAIQSVIVSAPVVITGQNGPGSPDVTTTSFDIYGRPISTMDPDSHLSSVAYDTATGAVTQTIADVNGLHLVTSYDVDPLGRTVKATDPNNNFSYTVYRDVQHEVRVYVGWNGSAPTGPTVVSRNNRAKGFTETLTMTAQPHLTGGVPDGRESFDITNLRSLERAYRNMAGQVDRVYSYFNFTNLTYDPNGVMGTQGTNFYQTQYGYDEQGRPNKVVSPTLTITRTVYDGQGRRVSSWIGTNDSPQTGYWSPNNPAGMIQVTAEQYDNGGVGDGYLTQETEYPAGNVTSPPPPPARVTQYLYDWRGRMVATKSGVQAPQVPEDTVTKRPITYLTYDNLDEVTYTDVYDGNNVTLTMGSNGVPNPPVPGLLRAHSAASYDYRGRVYQTSVSDVDQTTGNITATLRTTNLYYDHRGNLIENAPSGGVVTKTVYDGAGRPTAVYTTDGGNHTDWAAANTVANDIVWRQQETQYDPSGNVTKSIVRERFYVEPGHGPLGGPTSTTVPRARVTYSGMYYDRANRLTASVNIGTNDPSLLTPTVPSRSDSVLVTSFSYDDAGHVQDVTDPRGIVSRSLYNALGRTVTTIADYTNGTPTSDSNRTMAYTYDGSSHVATATATNVLPNGTTTTQQTQFIYAVTRDTGSDIDSNDILAATLYPDPATGQPTTDQQVTVTGSPTGGTFTLTLRGRTTGPIDYSATPAAVQSALEGLTTVGVGNVQVTGPNGGPWRVHFTGNLAGKYVPNLTANGTGLMGGTVAVATQQDTYTVNALGESKTATDRNNHTTSYAYNVLGQTVTLTRPMTADHVANVTMMTYDVPGNLATVTDPRNHTTSYGYDGLHRRTTVTDPLSHTITTTYDMRDNVTSVTDPLTPPDTTPHTTYYIYDALNRRTMMTDALQHNTVWAYNVDGSTKDTITDASNNTTTFVFDAFGRLSQQLDPPLLNHPPAVYTYRRFPQGENRLTV